MRARRRLAGAVRALLVESGLWTALRTRPFSRVPAADAAPHALFVTAIDTRPHAPSRRGRAGRPRGRLRRPASPRIAKLHARHHLSAWPRLEHRAAPARGATVEEFAGPHPAGTPGTHIHLLSPVDPERSVWHIGYQDVAAIGHLFATGRLDVERVIALAGPACSARGCCARAWARRSTS